MNKQEQLLKNYILSEIYNIEKKEFLIENQLFLEFEDLLQEGRIGDFFKNAGNKIVDFFRRNPREKETLQKLSKKNRELYEQTGQKKYLKKAEFYEDLDSKKDSSFFRRNATVLTLSLVVISLLKLYPSNPDIVDDTYDKTQKELSQKPPQNDDDIIKYLRSRGLKNNQIGSSDLDDVYGDSDYSEDSLIRQNGLAKLFIEMLKQKNEKISIEGIDSEINRSLLEKYLAWEFENERPESVSMAKHFKQFCEIKSRELIERFNKKKAEREDKERIEKEKENKQLVDLLGNDEFEKYDNLGSIPESELEEHSEIVLDGLDNDEFLNNYAEDYLSNGSGADSGNSNMRLYVSGLQRHTKDKEQKRELSRQISDMYMLSTIMDIVKSNGSKEEALGYAKKSINPSRFDSIIDQYFNN